MKYKEIPKYVSEYNSFIRSIKLENILNDNKLSIVQPKKSMFSFLYWRGRKKLKELMDLGGVIVGSRALKFYHYNEVPLLDRKCDDWDIVLTKNALMKFCASNKIYDFNHSSSVIRCNFNTGIFIGYNSYSPRKDYMFEYEFDLIAKDELPEFTQIGNYRICKLQDCLKYKIDLIEKDYVASNLEYESKNVLDCNEIMLKIKSFR